MIYFFIHRDLAKTHICMKMNVFCTSKKILYLGNKHYLAYKFCDVTVVYALCIFSISGYFSPSSPICHFLSTLFINYFCSWHMSQIIFKVVFKISEIFQFEPFKGRVAPIWEGLKLEWVNRTNSVGQKSSSFTNH